MFHYTTETNKSIEDAIKSLEVNLKEEKFGVQWQIDIKETLQKKEKHLFCRICSIERYIESR